MTAIRLSPSGPVISNAGGGPYDPGAGARLRMVELVSTMSGNEAVPTTLAAAVICSDGFEGDDPLVLTLANPKEGLQYRAELRLDLFNITTSHNAIVVLYLESSVDGGSTWTERAKNAHVVQPQLGVGSEDNGQGREASVAMVLDAGADLGVVDGTTSSIRVRALAKLTTGSQTDVSVSSLASTTGQANLNGTIHMQLEECF
jgi:hypothetical protein